MKIGASAGLILRMVGWFGRFFGNCPCAALIASSTSVDAASMLRSRSNCSVTVLVPSTFVEVICARPLIWLNCVSSGSATVRGHGIGTGAGILRGDRDGREIHLRQRRDRQQRIGRETDQEDRGHQQRRGDRPADERRRNAHRSARIWRGGDGHLGAGLQAGLPVDHHVFAAGESTGNNGELVGLVTDRRPVASAIVASGLTT